MPLADHQAILKYDRPFPGVDISIGRAEVLARDDLREVHDLFDRTYEQANHEYLDHSLVRLRYIGRAREAGSLVGFALGDVVEAELPRLEGPQVLVLGGIGCIDPGHRRSGSGRGVVPAAASVGRSVHKRK